MTRSGLLLATLTLGFVAVASCRGTLQLEPSDHDLVLAQQLLDAPNPARPGSYDVLTLYYGSGTDRNRPEYRDSVAIETGPVDASKLVDLGDQADERNEYWGFDPKRFPINGRVWYPDGAGPFPLVLVVHGNHDPRDFSDPGYDYLGELLASRGFILASVDMNFMNGGIRGENDARGWLLLKHLQEWKRFNAEEDSPFRGKVDLGNIALIGHSRGGEAVGHAAAFNRLDRYPDDANLTFDFDFDIKSIIAIAPVDGQYLPADQRVPVRDVNYLVFHGSHDGDVTSFHGLRQYKRVTFSGSTSRFKAAIYVYRANHGQWNTVWGPNDNGRRSGRILDLRGLLDPSDQREFGKLYVSAFLEATLKGDDRYLPMFRDHRVVGGWLPRTMYVTRFQESSFRPIADFEEDIDVTSGSFPGVLLRGDSLAIWREGELQLRSRNRPETPSSQMNQAVWLGWNNRIAGTDDEVGSPATYTIELPADLAERWNLGPGSTLDLALTATNRTPGPRGAEEEEPREEGTAGRRQDRDETDDDEKEPIDVTIELVDRDGHTARVPLSRYGPIRRPLEARILRRADLERRRFEQLSETVLQSYSLPLADFLRESSDLDLRALASVRLVFDRAEAGTVALDDVGFSQMDPAFLAAQAS